MESSKAPQKKERITVCAHCGSVNEIKGKPEAGVLWACGECKRPLHVPLDPTVRIRARRIL